MVEKRTCDYTGEEIEPGTGIMYVQSDGTVLHFVDSKAEKNFKLGREPRDLEWTEDGRRSKGPAQEEAPADEAEDADLEAEDDAEEEDVAEEEDESEGDDEETDSVDDEDVAEDDLDDESETEAEAEQ